MSDVLGVLFCAGLIGFGGWSVFLSLRTLLRCARCHRWVSVEGQIEHSELIGYPSGDPNFTTRIEYRYEVNGRTYRNDTVTLGCDRVYWFGESVGRLCAGYKVGDTADVEANHGRTASHRFQTRLRQVVLERRQQKNIGG